MKTVKLTFPNEVGLLLSAKLDLPDEEPKAFAISAHSFGGDKDLIATARISRALTQESVAVLRFDFTGLGLSEGEFSNTTFTTNITDIIYAAKYLRDNYQAPKLIIGHSLGGAAVIAAAPFLPEIDIVATIGAPSNPAHVSHLFLDHIKKIEAQGESTIQIAGQELPITKEYLNDIHQHNLEGILKNFRKTLVLFHSPIDQVVNVKHAGILYKAAKHPKSFISLDKADHMLTKKEDAEFVASILGDWAKRYVYE